MKLNGVQLSGPKVGPLAAADNWIGRVEDGWWIFAPPPKAFAVGPNLVSIRLRPGAPPPAKPVAIEKLEAHVHYNPNNICRKRRGRRRFSAESSAMMEGLAENLLTSPSVPTP